MMKAAIYCRLSDEDRDKSNHLDDSESIQNQKSLLCKYAVQQDWDIYRIYSDDDYSGLDRDRPEWNRLLKDAEARKFNIVLCKSQSRFTRDMEQVEKYLHTLFAEWGIRFIGLTDHADTMDKGNKKQRQIMGLTNEWYCEEVSENIRAVFDIKRSEGKFIGSFAAYGYRKDPSDRNRLIVDEEAARIVKRIFDWYLERYGAQHIAAMLNEQQVPGPSGHKRKTAGCTLWNKTTVRRILKNELYTGCMVQGKRKKVSYKSNRIISVPRNQWFRVENTHEPIIENNRFSEVQRRIEERQRSTGDGKAHIFSTKVRCADCGSSMVKVSVLQRSDRRYSYLRCGAYGSYGRKAGCTSHSIRLDLLEQVVFEKLCDHIVAYLDEKLVSSTLQSELETSGWIKRARAELIDVQKKLQKSMTVMKNLYYDRASGTITEDQFRELASSISSDRARFADRLTELKKALGGRTEKRDHWMEAIKQRNCTSEPTRTMISELTEMIEIGEKNPETGEQKVKIHWSF